MASASMPEPRRFISRIPILVSFLPPLRENEKLGTSDQVSLVCTVTSTLPSALTVGLIDAVWMKRSSRRMRSDSCSRRLSYCSPGLNSSWLDTTWGFVLICALLARR